MEELYSSLIIYLQGNWISILWILVLFFAGKLILSSIIRRAVRLADDGDDTTDSRKEKQAETLGHIISATGNVVIYLIILLMILDLFMIDITPILAGAGIVGLAVGFGAQTLVKDLVSGLFILLEHRYSIGDQVKLGDFEGEVVKITMRSTVLKNKEGKVFYISNGHIKKVENHSQAEYYQEQ